jgi:hypothetical protein
MSVSQDGPSAPGSGRKCFGKHEPHDIFVDLDAKGVSDCGVMRTQPNFVLRRFISTMAAMNCAQGPFGPSFRFGMKRRTAEGIFDGLTPCVT